MGSALGPMSSSYKKRIWTVISSSHRINVHGRCSPKRQNTRLKYSSSMAAKLQSHYFAGKKWAAGCKRKVESIVHPVSQPEPFFFPVPSSPGAEAEISGGGVLCQHPILQGNRIKRLPHGAWMLGEQKSCRLSGMATLSHPPPFPDHQISSTQSFHLSWTQLTPTICFVSTKPTFAN